MNRERLMAEYRQLCADQRKMIEHADTEKRDFNSEETASYDRMTARLGDITKQIERLNALETAEARMNESRGIDPSMLPNPAGDPGDTTDPILRAIRANDWSKFDRNNRGDEKHRADWLRYMRMGEVTPHLRALSTNTSEATGQYLAPKWMYTDVTKYLMQEVVMRRLCTVRTSNTNMDIPIMQPPTAVWKAEAAAFSETDPTFANKTLTARKLTALIKVSEELLADSGIDLEDELMMGIQVAFAEAEEKAFLVGTGSGDNQPRGVVLDAGVGKTAAATGAITADEVIDFHYSLKPQYRPNGVMFFNDSTLAAIRKLKGSDNNYLWVMGLGGAPDTILGRPVYANSNMATMAASAVAAVFFDPRFYRIQDRPGVFSQKLVELYAGNGQVGFRMFKRTDGVLTIAEAAKNLVMAAA